MSTSREDEHVAARSPETPRRSRWQRFSPSMGWRAFWSEILIVVLGVVIALAANEAVAVWTWNNKVQDAETRLQGDIAWVFVWTAEKYVTQPCVDAQLDSLSRSVLASGTTLNPAAVMGSKMLQHVVRMPNRSYRFPTWDAVVADGTATHFSPQRQAFLGRTGDAMARLRGREEEANRLLGRLLVMRDPIPLDPQVRSNLLSTINELRSLVAYESLAAQQRLRGIADAGSAPPPEVVDAFFNISGTDNSSAVFSGTAQYCKAQGLPLADWRDYQEVLSGAALPGMETHK